MKIKIRLVTIVFIGCFATCGIIIAGRLDQSDDRLVMDAPGVKGIATLYTSRGHDEQYRYEFRKTSTGTFWKIDDNAIEASWREFSTLVSSAKITLLQNLTQTWLHLTEQPNNFTAFGYPGAETIHWHHEAAQYLENKIRVNPDVEFTWLEKVALYAVTSHVDMFTHKEHGAE